LADEPAANDSDPHCDLLAEPGCQKLQSQRRVIFNVAPGAAGSMKAH
jgi:hypothetical protein